MPGAVKIGEHGRGMVTTGDGRDGIVSPAARDRVRAFVRQRLGGLDPAPACEVTCLYTSTASEDFILDRYGPFVVCSPCSGHGAKFAPLVGEIAADLACGGASPDPRFTLAAHFSSVPVLVPLSPCESCFVSEPRQVVTGPSGRSLLVAWVIGLKPLVLSEAERQTLENCAKRRKTAQGLALRARIVLACADGHSNTAVAARLLVSRPL